MIKLEKSRSQVTQRIEFLGFVIEEMMFKLPQARVKQIKDKCKKILKKDQVTMRELASI